MEHREDPSTALTARGVRSALRAFGAVALLALVLPVTAEPVMQPAFGEVMLRYDAFLGSTRAGVVKVALTRDGDRYAVRGEAKSKGLMETLKSLKARFSASGTLADGEPHPERYEYYQKDNSKERLISVRDGEVSYQKNGEVRPTRPALPGMDMVTALWVAEDCHSVNEVHTGRSAYHFSVLAASPNECHYRVEEEDEEPFELAIRYGQRDGVRVPLLISSKGGWGGQIRIRD